MVVVKSKKVSPSRGRKLERGLRKLLQKLKQDNDRADQLIATTDPVIGPIERYRNDPALILHDAGMPPDPWQADVLAGNWRQALLNCARQSGKSQVAAALALHTALCVPESLVLLLSPTLRQSGELFRDKVLKVYKRINKPIRSVSQTALSLTLTNGSRIISLPGEEGTIQGYSSVALLIIDEAARVSDGLYSSVRPMLAVSRGRLMAMSTPFGQRGWWWKAWEGIKDGPQIDTKDQGEKWKRVQVMAHECPRITHEFLADELEKIGDRWFSQEYLCQFLDMIGALIRHQDIRDSFQEEILPLFSEMGIDGSGQSIILPEEGEDKQQAL